MVGDGVIAATPTGSTAYSLAAGGSIVHHEVPAILITPVCPHSLSFRPVIVPDNLKISFKVPENFRNKSWVTVDGHSKFKLRQGAYVEISLSEYPVPHVKLKDNFDQWLNRINSELSWNKRKEQLPLL